MGTLPRRRQLHPKQRKLLEILADSIKTGDALSLRDMMSALKVTSLSIVQHHLRMLERNGYLKRNPGDPQHFSVVGAKPEAPVARLSVYGLVQCGPNGSIFESDPVDRVVLSSKHVPFPANEMFLVRARGDSMLPKIKSGDLVLVRKSERPENGNIIVCVNEGQAMIKIYQASPGRGVILSSLNQAPEFAAFMASRSGFRPEGVVVGSISYSLA